MYDFEYLKPKAVADAASILAGDDEAKALAGGMTFIPVLKQRLNKPSKVVDLAALGLAGIKVGAESVEIGAMTTHGAVAASADVKRAIPALALGATIVTNKREIAVDDYFKGMFTTALQPGELITKVIFPIPAKAAYEKFKNPASRYAMVGVFVAKGPKGVRVAITGAAQDGVYRHKGMEAALSANWSPASAAAVKTGPEGLNSDIHASAEYRAHLIGVVTKRAVAAAG